MSARGIPHCPVKLHAGFPLPCVRCANPVFDAPRPDSVRRMLPATTTAAARTRRLAADAAAAKRGGR